MVCCPGTNEPEEGPSDERRIDSRRFVEVERALDGPPLGGGQLIQVLPVRVENAPEPREARPGRRHAALDDHGSHPTGVDVVQSSAQQRRLPRARASDDQDDPCSARGPRHPLAEEGTFAIPSHQPVAVIQAEQTHLGCPFFAPPPCLWQDRPSPLPSHPVHA